jgi:hypothetical protein
LPLLPGPHGSMVVCFLQWHLGRGHLENRVHIGETLPGSTPTPIPALSWPTLASCSRAHLEVASCVPLGLLCLHLPFHSFYKGGHALVAEPLARGPTRGMFQLVRSGHLLQKQQTIMVKRQERIYSTSSGVTDVCPSVLSSWNPR